MARSGWDPCPGYVMELFARRDATSDGVNSNALYRLNCRPLKEIPARGSAVFEMVADVPTSVRAGSEMWVTWKLLLPHLVEGGQQRGEFSVKVVTKPS